MADNRTVRDVHCSSQFSTVSGQTKKRSKAWADELKNQSNHGASLASLRRRKQRRITLSREEADRIYLSIEPKAGAKQREFVKAELVLLKKSMLPDRVWFRQVNGNEIEWKVTSMDLSPMKPAAFAPPQPPGWKVVNVPATPAPGPGGPPR